MKATFRQEWIAGKNRMIYTSLVLAVVLLGAALVNFTAYQTKSDHLTFFGIFMYLIGLFIGTIGIPIYALSRGCGNIRSLLFSDTNYLMLLIPEHSWNLLGAKQLINLVEFVIYAIPSAVYLSFLGPTAGLIMHTTFNGITVTVDPGITYWENVKKIYQYVFVDHGFVTLQYVAAVIILFFVLQSAINCAYAIYSAFIHTKRPNRFLIAVIIFLLFYIPIRLGFLGMENFALYSSNASIMLWNYLWRFAAFGIGYFILAAWLMEYKIEV